MNFLPAELTIQSFLCPNCKQYISSESSICKFCSTEITPEMKDSAIENELAERKQLNLKRHKNYLILGIVLIGIGLFTLVEPIVQINYSNGVNFSCLTPVFIILGVGITIKSLLDYIREKRK